MTKKPDPPRTMGERMQRNAGRPPLAELRNRGKVHDWRNHVGEAVKSMWSTFSLEQRAAIAVDAYRSAYNEEWD